MFGLVFVLQQGRVSLIHLIPSTEVFKDPTKKISSPTLVASWQLRSSVQFPTEMVPWVLPKIITAVLSSKGRNEFQTWVWCCLDVFFTDWQIDPRDWKHYQQFKVKPLQSPKKYPMSKTNWECKNPSKKSRWTPSKTPESFATFPRCSTILATTRSRLWSKRQWIMGLPWCRLWIPVLYPTGALWHGQKGGKMDMDLDEYDKFWYWDVTINFI